MTDLCSVAGIVLAAGASQRMGSNKLLLDLEGESLVRRAARRAVDARLTPVVVVLGHEVERVRAELDDLAVQVVENPDPTGPTGSSLHRGLDALGPAVDAVLVTLADMVLVSSDMMAALAAALHQSGIAVAASRYGDVIAPPFAFRRKLFEALRAHTGDGIGRRVTLEHREEAAFLDWPADALSDVDTPDDFETIMPKLRGPGPSGP